MSDLDKLGTACAFKLNEQEKTIGRLHGELAAKDAELTAAIIGRDHTIKELRAELREVIGILPVRHCVTFSGSTRNYAGLIVQKMEEEIVQLRAEVERLKSEVDHLGNVLKLANRQTKEARAEVERLKGTK